LRSCGPLAYFDNERTKQVLYALDDHVWSTKITDLDESVDFANLETEKLFSKLKSHKLSRKDRHNYDASRTSKLVITSVRVGGHDANPTNTTVSSASSVRVYLLVRANISSDVLGLFMASLRIKDGPLSLFLKNMIINLSLTSGMMFRLLQKH
jgi:hypothetical protein